jgi:hypothetical protein
MKDVSWQQYYRDQNKVEVLIKYTFKLPVLVSDFNIDEHPLFVRQTNDEIHVNYHRLITRSLLDDLIELWMIRSQQKEVPEVLSNKSPGLYIVGFIAETMSRINEEILNRKYLEGHVLLRTISQFDIYNVFIVDKDVKYVGITWPAIIPSFTEITKVSKGFDVIFIRDLIDAVTEYFYFNFDECIKKVITSLENYFIYYHLESVSSDGLLRRVFCRRKTKFRRLIQKNISESFYGIKERDLKILRDNMLYVYQIRNRVTHDKLRLKPYNRSLCKKAIKTLLYIYQSKFIREDNKNEYIMSVYRQFGLISDMIIGRNLDRYLEVENQESIVGRNEDDFNKWAFSNLKITKQEKI